MAPALSERRLLYAVLAAGVLRLVLALLLPIGDDEAYYWLWSRHLAWAYPDHPPMVAAVVAASTRLFGDGVFGIRAVNAVLASVLPLIVCAAGERIFDVETGVRAGWVAAALPALGVGTLIVSPDVPMAVFWALSLWTGWEALREGGRWWVAAGATMGLAMLSKLTSAGLIVGMAGAALTGGAPAGAARRMVRDRWMYAGAVIAAVLFAPIVAWNLEHHWFLAYITMHRERWMAPRFPLFNIASFAGGQVLYYGLLAPVLWAAAVWTLRREGPNWRYLAWMSLPVFVVMTAAAAQARTKPHWPAPAYLAAGIALGALWPEWVRARRRLLWGAAAATAIVTVLSGAALLLPWSRAQVATGIGQYDRLTEAVVRQAAARPDSTLIMTDRYQAASHIAYRVRERIPVTTFYGAFLIWQHPEAWEGWHAVYVNEDPERPGLDPSALCANLRQMDSVELRPDRPPGPIKIFACDGVHLPPPVVPPRTPLP